MLHLRGKRISGTIASVYKLSQVPEHYAVCWLGLLPWAGNPGSCPVVLSGEGRGTMSFIIQGGACKYRQMPSVL